MNENYDNNMSCNKEEYVMSDRIKVVHKIGKGKYYTASYKISDYLIVNFFYWCLVLPICALFKYGFYKPIKLLINKAFSKDNTDCNTLK